MAQVFRTEAAENDLQEIAYYIAVKDRRPLTAERIVDEYPLANAGGTRIVLRSVHPPIILE